MKKGLKIALIIIVALIILYFVASFIFNLVSEYNRTKNLKLDEATIVIYEDEYINYVDELYINAENYIGKEIVIEGFYDNMEYEGFIYNFVGREIKSEEVEEHEHDEDCEHSQDIGLEFVYDGELPEKGDFIQVRGKLAFVTDKNDPEMEYLALTDCNIKTDIPVGQKYVK